MIDFIALTTYVHAYASRIGKSSNHANRIMYEPFKSILNVHTSCSVLAVLLTVLKPSTAVPSTCDTPQDETLT